MGCCSPNNKEKIFSEADAETIETSDNSIHYLIETALQWWLILFNTRQRSFITLKLENQMLVTDCENVLSNEGLYCSGGMPRYKHAKTSIKLNKVCFNKKKAWVIPLMSMKYSRRKHAFIRVDENVLCALGGYEARDCILSSCEVYNVRNNKWQVIESLNYPRACATACNFQGHFVYVFGGTSKSNRSGGTSLIIEFRDFSAQSAWTVVDYASNCVCSNPDKLWCTQINANEIIIFSEENIGRLDVEKGKLWVEKSGGEKHLPDKRGHIKEYENKVFMILETSGNVGIYSLNDKKWSFQPHILLDI
eukprot:TRINITY_DN1649_c0_g2_i1.p1 TRINITY_DN1649_c0_g2~~TRINITY_DN1649_c0_g2_i1.p1  ORF type:complete len:306 (-),score=42.52 TRINITY_DN1649_c0_g2_i1:105-1022(-)